MTTGTTTTLEFASPVLLAAGTCGFGEEVADLIDLSRLGGFVTKSITAAPRRGNPAPRVTEFPAGMLNSIGLANPGVERAFAEVLPRIIERFASSTRIIVSVAGHTEEEYADVVERLEPLEGIAAFEINLSCPNDAQRGGAPFALDRAALARVLAAVRLRTARPLFAKLAPNDPGIGETARAAAEAGADALTLVNTLPGRIYTTRGAPALGAGRGGVSGPALRPVGVEAVAAARAAVDLPLVGVGGVFTPGDACQYFNAGASLVQVGTASFAAPRAAERVAAAFDPLRLALGGSLTA
ncbi:MAG: dihydroorotate dehydrogenase [Longimicrobiales bacterium]|nr:dihydroorotate dehydrogenase [Longimicrobiales bacterium]